MIGLKQDFIHNGKAMMTIDRVEGYKRNELSEVQLQMLISNEIPGHLPMSVKEINQNVTFHYNITGKKMLSQTVRYEKLSLTALFQLFLQITETLLACPQYMLDEHRYVLHEDYIFTADTLEEMKIFMCYIPVSLEKEADSIPLQLNQMIIRMMPFVKALEGTGIQRMIQLCNESGFQLVNLQKLLNELLMGMDETRIKSTPSTVKTDTTPDHSSVFASSPPPSRNQKRTEETLNGLGNLFSGLERTPSTSSVSSSNSISELSKRSSEASPSFSPFKRSPFDKQSGDNRLDSAAHSMPETMLSQKGSFAYNGTAGEEDEQETDQENKKPSKPLYYWLGGMLLASGVWRLLYMDEPTQTKLVVCVVLTGVLAVAAYMLSTGKIPLGTKNKKDAEPWRWNKPSGIEESEEIRREREMTPLRQPFRGGDDFDIASTSVPLFTSTSTSTFSSVPTSRPSPVSIPTPEPMEQKAEENAASYYEALYRNTQLLNTSQQAQATVLLTDSSLNPNSNQSVSAPVLTLKKGILERQASYGAKDQIELSTGSFIIGRSEDISQFVEEGKGTSRAHIEINTVKDQYFIKDLNSVNGTLLLDEKMIPYKEYPLQDGDYFLIADSKYTFRYL